MVNKSYSIFDYLELFFSLFTILIMVLVLIYSTVYWVNNFPYSRTIEAQYFYAGVGIAVITVCSEWISGRLKAINRNFSSLIKNKRRKNARKRK